MQDRPGGVTFRGQPHTVRGPILEVGQPAPDFTVVANDYSSVSLSDYGDKIKLISVVPSLATRLCDAQTRHFNEEVSSMGDGVVLLTISAEHPSNQWNWCGASGLEGVVALSCHKDMAFADAYGVHDVDFRWCQRSVFLLDQGNTLRYVEYVPEIGQEVNFEAALNALKSL